MVWQGCETHLKAKYRRQTRTIVTAVEDTYLRDDVPCGSALCTTCAPTTSYLSSDAPFIMLPDERTLSTFLELLELPEVANYVILSSELRKFAMRSNMRKSARMRALYRDNRRHCFLFSDVNCLNLHALARPGQPSILSAAYYYASHLQFQVPVVVVSDTLAASLGEAEGGGAEDALEDDLGGLLALLDVGGKPASARGPSPLLLPQSQHLPRGVHVVSTQHCFTSLWGHCPPVVDLFDSLTQAKKQDADGGSTSATTGGDFSYSQHYSQQELEEGLADGKLLRGLFQVSKRNPFEALVQVGSSSDTQLGRLIQVSGRVAMNRAIDGDSVVVRLVPSALALPKSEGEDDSSAAADDVDFSAELLDVGEGGEEDGVAADGMMPDGNGHLAQGVVVGILQQQSRDIVSCVSSQDEAALAKRQEGDSRQEALICVPMDRRLSYVRVRTRQAWRLLGMRFVIRIDSWERSSRYPNGHVVKILGPIHELKAESEAVLVQCGINWQPFCQGAMAELPHVPDPKSWRAAPEELMRRRDLRGPEYFVVSVDPVGCTDIDDAMHVRFIPPDSQEASDIARLAGGRKGRAPPQFVEVGVHIADVSFFVRPGGLLDGEARDRCTSVYLVDKRLDMLPSLLSEHLCSLRSKSERYAASVIWTLDAEKLEPVCEPWFGRTVISSRHELHYQQAQDVLDGRPLSTADALPISDQPPLLKSLVLLKRLTDKLHAKRLEDGALELTSAELKFQVDESGQPCSVLAKKQIPMMEVVAEMMIMANAAVALRIATAFPGCALLRNHPPPRQESFEQVRGMIEGGKDAVDVLSNRSLSRALADACARTSDPAVAQLIKSMTTRAMSEAKYFSTGAAAPGSSGCYHYGLALPYYTHFTSPIRRYADVIVHRQLMAALHSEGGEGVAPMPHAELADSARTMNERHREAKAASKECSEMYLLLLLHLHPHAKRALVVGIQDNSIEVYIPKYHLKGRVRVVDNHGNIQLPLTGDAEEEKVEDALAPRRKQVDQGLLFTAQADLAQITKRSDSAVTGGSTAAQAPVVWQVKVWQHVWVRLAAAGSRLHGPKLQMRFLADSHPLVADAAATTPATADAAPPAAAAPSTSSRGPTAHPTTHPASHPGAYNPLGVSASSVEIPSSVVPEPSGVLDEESCMGLTTTMAPEGVDVSPALAAHASKALIRSLQEKAAEYESKLAAASKTSTRKERWVQKLAELEQLMQALSNQTMVS